MEAEVSHIEQLGSEGYVYMTPLGDTRWTLRDSTIAVRLEGERIEAGISRKDRLTIAPRRVSLFDPETEVNLEYL